MIDEEKKKEIILKLDNRYFDKVKDSCPNNALFLGFIVTNERLDKNKCYVFCKEHREICTPIISNLLHRKTSGCKACAKSARVAKYIKGEDVFLKEIEYACERLNCTFNGYVDGYKGSYYTEGVFVCNEHGEVIKTNCRAFCRKSRKTSGCPKCVNSHFLEISKSNSHRHISDFLSTGRYHEDTIFERDEDRVTKAGARNYWKVTCGDCGESYPSFTGSLKSGRIGCSCGKVINNMGFYPERIDWKDTLYLLELKSKGVGTENFCKIGRSFVFDRRLSNLGAHYTIKVLATVNDIHKNVFKYETELLKLASPWRYTPEISFGGQGECFTSEILDHPEIISTFNLQPK